MSLAAGHDVYEVPDVRLEKRSLALDRTPSIQKPILTAPEALQCLLNCPGKDSFVESVSDQAAARVEYHLVRGIPLQGVARSMNDIFNVWVLETFRQEWSRVRFCEQCRAPFIARSASMSPL